MTSQQIAETTPSNLAPRTRFKTEQTTVLTRLNTRVYQDYNLTGYIATTKRRPPIQPDRQTDNKTLPGKDLQPIDNANFVYSKLAIP